MNPLNTDFRKGVFIILATGLLMFVWPIDGLAATQQDSDLIPNKNVPLVVERIFGEVFSKKINAMESEYWKKRARTDKKTEEALKGAMAFQKAKGLTMPDTSAKKAVSVTPKTNSTSTVASVAPLLTLSDVFVQLDGIGVLIANDGTYLGLISSNQYSSNSIINSYGTYGSKYSSKSIFNEYGRYGGAYSSQSPFNNYTSTPPRIFLGNTFIGYLTTNSFLSSGINTYSLVGYLQSH